MVMGTPRLSGSEPVAGEQVYQRALALLTRRDHSAAELERKLSARGFTPEAIGEVLGRLTGQGFIDDRRFAGRFAESSLRSGRYVGKRLILELQRRGISRQIADEAVAEASAEQGESRVLAALLAKRFSSFDPSTASLQEQRRVFAYLQRKGFSIAAIRGGLSGVDEDE